MPQPSVGSDKARVQVTDYVPFPSMWKIYTQRRVSIMSTLRCPNYPPAVTRRAEEDLHNVNIKMSELSTGSDKARVQAEEDLHNVNIKMSELSTGSDKRVYRLLTTHVSFYVENIQAEEDLHNVNIKMSELSTGTRRAEEDLHNVNIKMSELSTGRTRRAEEDLHNVNIKMSELSTGSDKARVQVTDYMPGGFHNVNIKMSELSTGSDKARVQVTDYMPDKARVQVTDYVPCPSMWKIYRQRRISIMLTLRCPNYPPAVTRRTEEDLHNVNIEMSELSTGSDKARVQAEEDLHNVNIKMSELSTGSDKARVEAEEDLHNIKMSELSTGSDKAREQVTDEIPLPTYVENIRPIEGLHNVNIEMPQPSPGSDKALAKVLTKYRFPSTWKIYSQRRVSIMSTLRCQPPPGSDKAPAKPEEGLHNVNIRCQPPPAVQGQTHGKYTARESITTLDANHPPAVQGAAQVLYIPSIMENIQPEFHSNIRSTSPRQGAEVPPIYSQEV
ncbi:hypothetical protein J6590_028993 [Homalodisca vitripennis]|nr:hypothetical protein J6590_028993 [Homalodisca vitripennis]